MQLRNLPVRLLLSSPLLCQRLKSADHTSIHHIQQLAGRASPAEERPKVARAVRSTGTPLVRQKGRDRKGPRKEGRLYRHPKQICHRTALHHETRAILLLATHRPPSQGSCYSLQPSSATRQSSNKSDRSNKSRPTLCSKQKSISSPLCSFQTFRHVSTPLRTCTYAQRPQARETRQTCRQACPALEQKSCRKSASVWP